MDNSESKLIWNLFLQRLGYEVEATDEDVNELGTNEMEFLNKLFGDDEETSELQTLTNMSEKSFSPKADEKDAYQHDPQTVYFDGYYVPRTLWDVRARAPTGYSTDLDKVY